MIAPIRRPAGSEKENPDSVDHLRSAQAGEQEENSFCLVLHSSYPRRGKYSYRRYSGAKRCDSNGWSLRESLDNEIAESLQSDTRLSGCCERLTSAPSDRAT